jgi:hypothetical protein
MTKPTCKVDHRSLPRRDIKGVLAAALATGPQDTYDIARKTGYSVSCVRRHLGEMKDARAAYSQRVLAIIGFSHRWYLGEAPAIIPDITPPAVAAKRARVAPGEVPKRLFRNTYPTINRRDPLVSALFGAAGEH